MEKHEKEILDIIIKVLSIKADKINDDNYRWDSLKHISLITKLEMEFGVFYEPKEISEMNTIPKVIEITKNKIINN